MTEPAPVERRVLQRCSTLALAVLALGACATGARQRPPGPPPEYEPRPQTPWQAPVVSDPLQEAIDEATPAATSPVDAGAGVAPPTPPADAGPASIAPAAPPAAADRAGNAPPADAERVDTAPAAPPAAANRAGNAPPADAEPAGQVSTSGQ